MKLIPPSDTDGAKTVPMTVQFRFGLHLFDENLENYGKNGVGILGVAAASRRSCNLELGN